MDFLFVKAIGGIGMFLLGMLMLTDGLRALAGQALRRQLRRSTRTPASGAVTGALTTAVVQSSSATTVAAVGFVGAGLMTFPQALGIIFGANIGTTITGWIVAIVGFKLQLGLILTPAVLFGVVLRLFAPGRWKHVGWAVAGFSLLFVGIAAMQEGMAMLKDWVSPTDFPADTITGRLQLVAIGIAITIVTQSSSAGVATALAALSADAISFTQAAAMVVGMDVGTTFTAALATLGASTAGRQTGFAHVIYNVLTGIVAFLLLAPLSWAVDAWRAAGGSVDQQLGLVAFHSAFNLVGVVAVIGFTARFADFVTWMVPERGPLLTARLGERLLSDAAAATDSAAATAKDITQAALDVLERQLMADGGGEVDELLDAVGTAQMRASGYVQRIRTDPAQPIAQQRHQAVIHELDHLARLYQRCRQQERIDTIVAVPELRDLARGLTNEIEALRSGGDAVDAERRLNALRKQLRTARHDYRDSTIARASRGEIEPGDVMARLDAVRWLHRVAYHVWRIVHHQNLAASDILEPEPDAEPEIEAAQD